MNSLSVRPADEDLEFLVLTYSNLLFQLCFTILGNRADAEDAVSDVILKYMTRAPVFREEEHRKAWLLRTASNHCKDMLRFRKRRSHVSLDDVQAYCAAPDESGILQDLLSLPEKYRTVLHLYYMEGYSCEEIGTILSLKPATVRKRMQVGREKLKLIYGKDGTP